MFSRGEDLLIWLRVLKLVEIQWAIRKGGLGSRSVWWLEESLSSGIFLHRALCRCFGFWIGFRQFLLLLMACWQRKRILEMRHTARPLIHLMGDGKCKSFVVRLLAYRGSLLKYGRRVLYEAASNAKATVHSVGVAFQLNLRIWLAYSSNLDRVFWHFSRYHVHMSVLPHWR